MGKNNTITYQQNKLRKYISESYGTVSMKKIEDLFVNGEKRALDKTILYFKVNNIVPKKHMNPNFYERWNKVDEFLGKTKIKNLFPITEDKVNELYKYKDDGDKEFIKAVNNFYALTSKKESECKSKEIIRVKCQNLVEVQGLSYNFISKNIFNNEIDTSNLYKFIKKKNYNTVSLRLLKEKRGAIKEWMNH